jgi:hypothetical protein
MRYKFWSSPVTYFKIQAIWSRWLKGLDQGTYIYMLIVCCDQPALAVIIYLTINAT